MIYVLSGGGSGKLFAAIGVTYPEGSTLTCTNGTKTLKAKTTTGRWVFAIPDAGTWTVTATDGAKSKSKTVEITKEGESVSVELSYGLYLYKNGDQCVDITGGWTSSGYSISGTTTVAPTLNADFISFRGVNGKMVVLGTADLIDVSKYKSLCFEVNVISTQSTYHAIDLGVYSTKTALDKNTIAYGGTPTIGVQTVKIDITAVDSAYLVFTVSGSTAYQSDVYAVWLE